jgi:hypothetical protein
MLTRIAAVTATAGLLTLANPAHAHIKLLKPASAIQENSLGGPQKDGPCGPGPTEGQGMPSNQVTTFMEGEEITVEWTETVNHEGHFRIAVAKDPSEFEDPKITGSCQSAEIQNPPVLPVLADGLFATTRDDGNRNYSQKVKLPAGFTCDKCTLQLIQFMTPHPAPCLYYHCANIKIVSATAAGSGAAGATGGAAAVSGQGGGPAAAGAAGSVIAMTGGGGAGGSAVSTGAGGAVSTAPKPAGATSMAVPSAGTTASAGRAAVSAAGSSATRTTATAMNGVTAAPPASAPKSGSGGCTTTRAHAGDGAFAGFMLLGLAFATRCRRSQRAYKRLA